MKLKLAIIITGVFILAILAIGIYQSTTIINTQHDQLSQATARINMLEIDIIAKQHIIKDLRADNVVLSADVDRLNTRTIADGMMIAKLTDNYATALRWIGMAEWILGKQGITYIFAGERK